jgi:hypothetical protein
LAETDSFGSQVQYLLPRTFRGDVFIVLVIGCIPEEWKSQDPEQDEVRPSPPIDLNF